MMFLHTVVGAISLAVCVSTASAQQHADLPVTGQGIVVPARSWDVSPETSNQIAKIHFVRGQRVKKGDVLVEMDKLITTLDLELAEVAVLRAKAAFALTEETLQRQTKLKDRDIASVAKFRDAEINAELARADLLHAEVKLKKAKAFLQVQTIYAPFDGQMSALRYRDNANVDIADGTEISTLVQLDPIHVLGQEPFTDSTLDRLNEGKVTFEDLIQRYRAQLVLPNGAVYPHEGRAVSIAFDVDSETGMASFLLEFPNPRTVLRPGLKVQVINILEPR